MSYEYNIVSNVTPIVLYEKINYLIKNLPDYYLVGSNRNSSSFGSITSTLEWESDIDLLLSDNSVTFHIHSGNTGILSHIIKSLAKLDIQADFQEL